MRVNIRVDVEGNSVEVDMNLPEFDALGLSQRERNTKLHQLIDEAAEQMRAAFPDINPF